MRTTLVLILLLFATPAFSQSVTLPADTKAAPGDLVPIEVKYVGDDVKVKVSKGLTVFRVYDPDPTHYLLMLYVPPKTAAGMYEIIAVAVLKGKLSEFAACTVTVGGDPGPFDKGKTPTPPDKSKAPSATGQEYRPIGFQSSGGLVTWVVTNKDAVSATIEDSRPFFTRSAAQTEADRLNKGGKP